VRPEGGDHRAGQYPDGGQRACGSEDLPDVGEACGQPAFDEDHRQSGRADVAGQFDVVEVQAEAVLADRDADEQEEQQAGEADACRDARPHDAGQQHQAADQQRQVELLQGQVASPIEVVR
jgi:hypothetical protein